MDNKTILELHYSNLEDVTYNLISEINNISIALKRSELNEILINKRLSKINSNVKYLKLLKNDIVSAKNE